MTSLQIRQLARRLDVLERDRIQRKQANLGFSTIDGGAIQAQDETGALTMIVGQQFDGTNTSAVVNGPTPSAPAPPSVLPGIGTLRVSWNGLFADGSVAPMDFARVLIYAEPLSSFTEPDALNQGAIVGQLTGANGGEITAALDPGVEHAVYLVTWTQAGKFSAPSDVVQATPGTEVPVVAAPEESPTLTATGTANGVVLRASSVAATTTIEYHISTVEGFTPGPDTLAIETRSLVTVISALPDGTPLAPDTTYYFRAVAKNALGEAAPSPEIFQALDLTVVRSVVVEEVVAGFVLAGQIQVGSITIDPDQGIRIPLADGGLIHLPADGSDALISARLRTSDLVVDGGLLINGVNNAMSGELLLTSGVTDPSSLPSVTFDRYPEAVPFNNHAYGTSNSKGGFCLTSDGTEYVTTLHRSTDGEARAIIFASVATWNYTRQIDLVPYDLFPISCTRAGSTILVVGQRWSPARGQWELRIHGFNETTGAQVLQFAPTYGANTPIPAAGRQAAISYDHSDSNIVLAHKFYGEVAYRKFTTGGAPTQAVILPSSSGIYINGGMYVGSAGGVEDGFVYLQARVNLQDRVMVWAPTLGRRSELDFGVGHPAVGLWWDGVRFKQIMDWSNLTGVYSWSTNLNSTLDIAYNLRDGDASGDGTHETLVSPRLAVDSIPRRSFVRLATPAPPYDGTVDSPNQVSVYTSQAPGGTLHLLETRGTGPTNQFLVDDREDLGGALVPTVNTFASANGGVGLIRATDGGFQIDGSSDGSVGSGSFRDSIESKPTIKILRTASWDLPNASLTQIPWDTLAYSRGGMSWSASGVPITRAGIYEIHVQVATASTAGTGFIQAQVTGSAVSGNVVVARNNMVAAASVAGGSTKIYCTPGDVITLSAWQSNGAARSLFGGAYETALTVSWDGPL